MRIVYLTTDQVNPALARRWATGRGVRVVVPRQIGSPPPAAAVVLDFDHLPSDVYERWVADVLAGAESRPVLVHGHNIPEPTAVALRTAGSMVVAGCLRKPHFARWLRRLVPAAPPVASVPAAA